MTLKFKPSKAHRWWGGGCTGSVAAEAAMDKLPSSDVAAEGIRLHEVAASLLTSGNNDCNPDDWSQVRQYVETVREYAALPGAVLDVEVGIAHDPIAWGVMDARITLPDRRVIIDLKTGFSPVEAVDNKQLLTYAIMHNDDLPTSLVIVQPNGWHRDGPVRRWTAMELGPHRRDMKWHMEQAEHDPQLVATPANCRYCAAVSSCAAARTVTLGGHDMALKDTGKLPATALRTELVTLRTASKIMKARLDGLEAEVEARLRGGEHVPGCGMRAGRAGSLKWSADPERVRAVCTMAGVDPTRTELVTPKQAIDAGIHESIVATMAKRGPGKLTLSTEPADSPFKDETIS